QSALEEHMTDTSKPPATDIQLVDAGWLKSAGEQGVLEPESPVVDPPGETEIANEVATMAACGIC
ncbi:MAG: hypothetical protein KDJ29_04775, partial [Hyphomicrobiales bacterium]|nr:hypothetical protein [Hyphomicrobiales bacterium]